MTDDELLETYAHPAPARAGVPRWWFSTKIYTYTREQALTIIGIHQKLGTDVTDILTSRTFAVLVDRVLALEQQVRVLSPG